MVDRLVSDVPADLRFKIFKSVADLVQYNDGILPEGARAVVLQEDSAGGAPNGSGMREFVFTRQPTPEDNALVFTSANGAFATATRNVYRSSSSGYLWVQWPQQYLIQLNAATPVGVADVATVFGGSPLANARLYWRRLTAAAANGQPLFTLGDNEMSVVSQANDAGQILVSLYAGFLYA